MKLCKFLRFDAQPVHSGITFLLDHMPFQMYLVIATRADPPFPLARLRGRGELTELRASDLRFTPDEITAFLNNVMDLNLSPEDIANNSWSRLKIGAVSGFD